MTAALLALVLCQAAPPDEPLRHGRELARLFFQKDDAALFARAGPALRADVPTVQALRALRERLEQERGREHRLTGEWVEPDGAGTRYVRLGRWTRDVRGGVLVLTWDAEGRLASLSAGPPDRPAPTPHAGRAPRTPLRLPVAGTWDVLWGGATLAQNAHAAVPDMRFALDLLVVKGPGTFAGDGTRNAQYHCWGKPVLAPADGVVVQAVDGVPDNAPYRPSAESLWGNVVVLDHGHGEFSLLAHLQRGSVAVRVGEKVREGQVLGAAGNSGASTEPHVHYQLMSAADFLAAQGLPARFLDYVADGAPVASGEPVKGQRVARR